MESVESCSLKNPNRTHVQVASTSLHGLVVSLAPPALKKKLLSLEMRKDQVNNIH